MSDESPHHLPKITSNVDASFCLAGEPASGITIKRHSLVDISFTPADVFMSVEFLSRAAKFSADVIKPGTYHQCRPKPIYLAPARIQ
ncbi:MAG: hypothetical protein ACLS37_13655 [Alistipes sp.]